MWKGILIKHVSSLLKKVHFDVVTACLALMHIIKSETEPATNRIKRLLKVLSPYTFNLYYLQGKYMILSDFCHK